MKLIVEGTIEGLRTRNDGSIAVTLASQEMDSSQAANLFQLRNRYVKCLLSDSNISAIEEKLVDETEIQGGKKAKSPGQRLRAVMFRVHEANKNPTDFEVWYKGEMERIIEEYKTVLNEITT